MASSESERLEDRLVKAVVKGRWGGFVLPSLGKSPQGESTQCSNENSVGKQVQNRSMKKQREGKK